MNVARTAIAAAVTTAGLGLAAFAAVSESSHAPIGADESTDHVALGHPDVKPELIAAIAKLRAGGDVAPEWPEGWPFDRMYNREAPVPSQCYTRTEGFHNPCYVCHQQRILGRENAMDDHVLQEAYEFSDVGFTNHWLNLYEDRTDRTAQIGDEEILDYVREDNYSELAGRLNEVGFEGYIPDLDGLEDGAAAFDANGFAKDGSDWVAFNYKPLPSTFWPTNGATDDVMIRLPKPFRQTSSGAASRDAYVANLSLLEMQIKDLDRLDGVPAFDETAFGEDVDGDGELGVATSVVKRRHYVGGASNVKVGDTIYPKGVEFLHTVRYLDVDPSGRVVASKRMKEVRYMYRALPMTRVGAAYLYLDEQYDKEEGKLPRHMTLHDTRSLQSETGWQVSGFIEDAQGRLRANTFEETMFCMGCHNSVGATVDKTFSFARKVNGDRGWGYIDLVGMPDAPAMGETMGEIEQYLERVGGGAEYRNNPEMADRFYHADGSLNRDAVHAATDVYDLVTPSAERALALNKAYRVIVMDQDYVFGRDAILEPPVNVYEIVDPEDAPTLPEDRRFSWDIRLDWDTAYASKAQVATEAEAGPSADAEED